MVSALPWSELVQSPPLRAGLWAEADPGQGSTWPPSKGQAQPQAAQGLLQQTLPWLPLSPLLPAGCFPPARPLGLLMGMAQLPNPCPGRSRTHADRWRARGIENRSVS